MHNTVAHCTYRVWHIHPPIFTFVLLAQMRAILIVVVLALAIAAGTEGARLARLQKGKSCLLHYWDCGVSCVSNDLPIGAAAICCTLTFDISSFC